MPGLCGQLEERGVGRLDGPEEMIRSRLVTEQPSCRLTKETSTVSPIVANGTSVGRFFPSPFNVSKTPRPLLSKRLIVPCKISPNFMHDIYRYFEVWSMLLEEGLVVLNAIRDC